MLPHGWVWQVLAEIWELLVMGGLVTSVLGPASLWLNETYTFLKFYWIDKRSNELPALEDLGVCCVYFFFIFFLSYLGRHQFQELLFSHRLGIQLLWQAAIVLQPVSHTAAHSSAELLSSSESEKIQV